MIVHADPGKSEAEPQGRISDIMKEHRGLFMGYHGLNIVHHQDSYLVTMHLLMEGDSRIEEAHKVCDHLERDIKQLMPGAEVNIHIEPYKRR